MLKLVPGGFEARKVAAVAVLVAMMCRATDSDIVINEIMYHPPLDREDLQYVELFNRGGSKVDLSRWSFTKGITFVFPAKTALAPGGYLVVCRNRAAFATQYGREIAAVGDFSGRLSHQGERIELSDAQGKVVDALKYSDREPWPTGADGYSASLERICPLVSGREADNWAASQLPPVERSAGTPGRRNDSYSSNLPPAVSNVQFKTPVPARNTPVIADVADADGVAFVKLLHRIARSGCETEETEGPMQRIAGDDKLGTYQGIIPGQPQGTLVRFRIKAVDAHGTTRFQPSPTEPRPMHSYSTFVNTNTARLAFAHVLSVTPTHGDGLRPGPDARMDQGPPEPTRGNGAFVYVPPEGGQILTYDYVHVRPRGGGFKVHFQRDRPFKNMTGINVIFESSPRWILAEPLAYELYRRAGVPAPLTEHLRVWEDGHLRGYQLLIEQPNKSFLSRNNRDDSGNLYKLIWYQHGIVGQHEKKTNLTSGHDDVVQVIEGLRKKSGADQWAFIQQHFNVEEFINYFAVNMCIQNWDGFFNNYFTYHDLGGTGKWEIYPWDEDKTWGDYDGASSRYDWYEMPLTFGMSGDSSPQTGFWSLLGGGGGASWWRPAGWFSGPLLANPQFRQRFLTRLGEICRTIFTEETFVPVIDAQEKHLEADIPLSAQAWREDANEALRNFRNDIQSFRNQVKYRRKFILSELSKANSSR